MSKADRIHTYQNNAVSDLTKVKADLIRKKARTNDMNEKEVILEDIYKIDTEISKIINKKIGEAVNAAQDDIDKLKKETDALKVATKELKDAADRAGKVAEIVGIAANVLLALAAF